MELSFYRFIINNLSITIFIMTRMEINNRPVKSSLWIHRFITGSTWSWKKGQTDRLPPPRTLIMDFTFDPYAFWTIKFTPTWTTYTHKTLIDQIQSLSCPSQSIHQDIYDDCSRLLFLHDHRETSDLANLEVSPASRATGHRSCVLLVGHFFFGRDIFLVSLSVSLSHVCVSTLNRNLWHNS